MSHPLVSGFQAPPPIRANLVLNALPEGCLGSFDDLRKWLEAAVIEIAAKTNTLVSGSAGTLDAATVDDRAGVRLMFDGEGRCFGFATYSPSAKAWVRSGVPGELLTVFRTEDTVERDMEVKLLKNGWLLCDGAVTGAPDLVGSAPGENEGDPPVYADNDFFRRDGDEWNIYTVIKVA